MATIAAIGFGKVRLYLDDGRSLVAYEQTVSRSRHGHSYEECLTSPKKGQAFWAKSSSSPDGGFSFWEEDVKSGQVNKLAPAPPA